jgi:hypothetical protein
MRLDAKDIAGLPVKTARDLMRHFASYRIDAKTVLDFLNERHWRSTVDAACKADPSIPKVVRDNDYGYKQMCKIWGFKFKPIKATEVERVLAALIANGYLEPHKPEYKWDTREFELSRKGRQLAAANLVKRFDRAKADQEIADLIARANEINARDELVFYVRKITVFGSYLTDSNDLGDIDLVVQTWPRRRDPFKESQRRAAGKRLDASESHRYCNNEVLRLLRARKARLSLNAEHTLDTIKTEFRSLFEWQPDAKRQAKMERFR